MMTRAEVSERAIRLAEGWADSPDPYAERSGYAQGSLRHIRDGCETLAEARQLARDTLAILDATSQWLEEALEAARREQK